MDPAPEKFDRLGDEGSKAVAAVLVAGRNDLNHGENAVIAAVPDNDRLGLAGVLVILGANVEPDLWRDLDHADPSLRGGYGGWAVCRAAQREDIGAESAGDLLR
jgi:hypothetical protein